MTQEALDFTPRQAARATDNVTSVMAAERVAAHVGAGQMLALKAFAERPGESLDDFQLAEITGWRQTSIGKRRVELERAGLVVRTERRLSPSRLTGSVVQAYRITEAGVRLYESEARN